MNPETALSDVRELPEGFAEAIRGGAVVHAAIMLGCATAAIASRRGELVAIAGPVSLGVLALRRRAFFPRRALGWLPNAVTAIRLLLLATVVAIAREADGIVLAALVITDAVLDGVDGWLARRTDTVSALGGFIDMESDAYAVLAICVAHFLRGDLGGWVLVPGALRYGYVLCIAGFPSRGEAPRSTFARVAFLISLVGLTLGFLPIGPLALWGPALAAVLIPVSFARSLWWSLDPRSR